MSEFKQIRRYETSDYETVLTWWKAHGFDMAPEYLPETGFIVEGVCAGFLYKTDSKFALLEWIVANPDSEKTERRIALDHLIEAIKVEARNQGFTAIYTQTRHAALIARYEQHGFIKSDTEMTSLVGLL